MIEIQVNGKIKSEKVRKEFLKNFGVTEQRYQNFLNERLMYFTKRKNLEMVKEFLEEGANVNHQDEDGRTALMYAVSFTDTAIMKTLLEFGADPDIQDESGFSTIHHAVWCNEEKINVLYLWGGNLELKDKNGDCPHSLANNFGRIKASQLILELKTKNQNEKKIATKVS
ncbi:MAG: ankyrin repeat domain-containing protein [Candidatus Paceibacterota bacterium]